MRDTESPCSIDYFKLTVKTSQFQRYNFHNFSFVKYEIRDVKK